MVSTVVVQALSAYVLCWAIWKLFREYFVRSPLDNVPGPPPSSNLTGSIQQIWDPDGWDFHYDILRRYGSVMKLQGLFGERCLFLHDPKAMYHILVKDQYAYQEAPVFIATSKLYFGEGLLSTLGDQHKKQRKILNPVFSIAHMREMIPIFYEVTDRLRATLATQLSSGPREIDILHWMSRTALELIGQSGMGYSFDSLSTTDNGEMHPYSQSVKNFGALIAGPLGFLTGQYILPFAERFDSPAGRRAKRFLVECASRFSSWVKELMEITDTIERTALDIWDQKRAAMASGEGQFKKDIISILMRANESAEERERLSDAEVFGQIASLTFAAMDTTSSALSRILYLLSTHPDVQDKLRKEIVKAKKENKGELSYDQLVSLPYLDAVCRETLRVYPPLITTIRTPSKDMVLPLGTPIVGNDGTQLTELHVPKDTAILLSILGANTNEEMWGPDALEWRPERWLDGLPETVSEVKMPGVYSHLMTFLGGGRACIGFKFSQLEMKVVLSVLLMSFAFAPAPNKKISWKLSDIAYPVVENNQDPSKVDGHKNKMEIVENEVEKTHGGHLAHRELPMLMSLIDT